MSLLNHEMGGKKHKKHKSDRKERHDSPSDRPPGLKLILKVGSQGTPEHPSEWPYSGYVDPNDPTRIHHKKSKKKKKKKDKTKDRERKHRHHHKEKKRRREEEGLTRTCLNATSEDAHDDTEENIMITNDDASIGSPGENIQLFFFYAN